MIAAGLKIFGRLTLCALALPLLGVLAIAVLTIPKPCIVTGKKPHYNF